jgi:hypothetical protein
MIRNRNGDLIPQDQAQALYCGSCRRYLRPTGKRVPYTSPEVIDWSGECDWCRDRRLEREAEEAERRRREEEKVRPRQCQLESCGVWFTPATPWQRFHADECRWKAHRSRLKLVS